MPSNEEPRRFYGKYRAVVIDNGDPLFQGRILTKAAVLPDALLSWCMPCQPYSTKGASGIAVPPIGASVWIEFEAGDPRYPIWSGCFFTDST